MLKTLTTATLLTLTASFAQAHDYTVGEMSIAHPYAFETAPMTRAGGGYMTITNGGDTPDRLVAVTADFPRVEVHQSLMRDGVAVMEPVPVLEIAPGETVTFAPGGYHVMFMGLDAPLVDGTRFPATLTFEQAGDVEVEFAVEARTADDAAPMDHGAMDHGSTEDGAADPHAGH
ncbi:hypothetical protein SAMN04488003_12031 [Loktanella fryxellensis]|uniref:Copper(I)-binding protein n=1 Tax=Loktanella fryxellensis TaxID=245187 RepID=A0A1H8HBS5_9RHOB|nr:copper chaperone PCu(A)C [Loktanella fryxellensis]SEN53580.1 hypothetical protein SAMN04488003_12031 [Loktanella fryxellensis]